MNNKIISGLILISVMIANLSCNKYLTLQPQDGTIRQEFWKTKEQVQAAVTGCYASLLGPPAGTGDNLTEYLFMWGETRADMVVPGIGTSNDELDVMNVNTLPTNTVTNWRAVYRTINYCNTVIDFAPGVLANDNTFTQRQLDAYLSEAYALRGLMYFYLVRSFRDVPLKLKSTSSDIDLVQLPKTSADSVLTQIVSDLALAEANAVITFGNKDADKGRITKYTVNAIQADVYLWMEKYDESIAACDKIINSGQFGLIAGNSAWFNNLYYRGNSNEGIFEFQFDVQKLNAFYPMFIQRRRYLAAPRVMDDIYTVDFINDANKDIRGDGSAVRTSDNAIWKYVAVDFNSIRAADASYAHWFVYRYADILLMKAEAINQNGQGAIALVIVNQIRARANALPATDLMPDPIDKNAVGDYILAERAREFAFEGKRWYDILRNAKRNNYARLDLLLNMVSKTVPPDRQQSAIGKYRDKNSHYFPIYFYEIQTDKNLVQNPFYK